MTVCKLRLLAASHGTGRPKTPAGLGVPVLDSDSTLRYVDGCSSPVPGTWRSSDLSSTVIQVSQPEDGNSQPSHEINDGRLRVWISDLDRSSCLL